MQREERVSSSVLQRRQGRQVLQRPGKGAKPDRQVRTSLTAGRPKNVSGRKYTNL